MQGNKFGYFLKTPTGEIVRQAIKYYPITNNKVEYETVVAGLELAKEMGIEQIKIKKRVSTGSQSNVRKLYGKRYMDTAVLGKVRYLLH